MSSIKLESNASGTGIFTIASPNSNTNRTLTLPDATGTINTSGAVNEVPVGTVSAPSIYFSGATNTGIFSPAADTIAFAEGGTEVMRIDSSGNVGIGGTSAGEKLEVVGGIETSGGASSFNRSGLILDYQTGSSLGRIAVGPNAGGTLAFYTGNGATVPERMRITSAGTLLVGGTTAVGSDVAGFMALERVNAAPSFNFYRNDTSISSADNLGQIAFYGNDTTSNTPTALALIQAVASGTHAAGDNPTDLVFGCTDDGSETVDEFARIKQSGLTSRGFRLQQPTLTNGNSVDIFSAGGTAGTINRYSLIGVFKHSTITNACGFLQLSAEDAATNYLWADNSDVLRISTTASNIGTTGGTVVGTQTSDERLKDISGPVSYGLNEVLAIEPIAFTMKDDPSIPKIGFSAQQVQPIVPEAVYDTRECIDGYTENEETKEQIANSDRTKLAMEYTQLIPVLVNAVKELSAKCDALQAEVNLLKGN